MSEESTRILQSAKDASEAMRRLYQARKATDPRFSMSSVARALGVSSTGFISDVFHGKRHLHAKLRLPAAKLFDLKGEASKCLQLMIMIDDAKDPARIRRLRARLSLMRKAMRVTHAQAPRDLADVFFSLEVFCAFGLYGNRPRLQQLVDYFGEARGDAVAQALDNLVHLALIEPLGAEIYQLVAQRWMLSGQEGGLSHVDFIRHALQRASEQVETWFSRGDESAFISTIISAKRSQYRKLLAPMKEEINLMQAKLESGRADTLIRFNVQIYPVGKKA